MGNLFEKHTSDTHPPAVSPSTKPRVTTEKAIQTFVENLMKDPDINQRYIPDSIEKDAYLRLFTSVISHILRIAETLKIEVLNHVITIKIEPKDD